MLGRLAASVGLPFVLRAATCSLLQAWAATSRRNPYRLFAVSNLASLAALAAHPWLVEPWLAVERQALAWSIAYAAHAAAMCAVAWMLRDRRFTFDLATQSVVFMPALFVACMAPHGELAASRPAAAQLSMFDLCVAVGGAIGGARAG